MALRQNPRQYLIGNQVANLCFDEIVGGKKAVPVSDVGVCLNLSLNEGDLGFDLLWSGSEPFLVRQLPQQDAIDDLI